MPWNYEPAMICQLRRNNELLALQCELLIASLENDVYASDCHVRLERIMKDETYADDGLGGITELRAVQEEIG